MDKWMLLIALALSLAIAFSLKWAFRWSHYSYIRFKRDRAFLKKARIYRYWLPAVIGGLIVFPVLVYVLNFQKQSLSNTPEHWGQLGDFFGGMLNPILAFASFIALLYTIRIQSEELRLTREEFQKSVQAQERMAAEARSQVDIAKHQNSLSSFNLMFHLIDDACGKIKRRYPRLLIDYTIYYFRKEMEHFPLTKEEFLEKFNLTHVDVCDAIKNELTTIRYHCIAEYSGETVISENAVQIYFEFLFTMQNSCLDKSVDGLSGSPADIQFQSVQGYVAIVTRMLPPELLLSIIYYYGVYEQAHSQRISVLAFFNIGDYALEGLDIAKQKTILVATFLDIRTEVKKQIFPVGFLEHSKDLGDLLTIPS